MDAVAYVEGRLEPQIVWYDEKSTWNKRALLSVRNIEIICAAIIPLLSGYLDNMAFRFAIGLLAVVVVICAGVIALFQFQEHWITYRSAAEGLKRERFLFLTRAEPYNTEEPFEVLVQRVETCISQENLNWSHFVAKPKKRETHG